MVPRLRGDDDMQPIRARPRRTSAPHPRPNSAPNPHRTSTHSFVLHPRPPRHPGERRDPWTHTACDMRTSSRATPWVPAFTGMTEGTGAPNDILQTPKPITQSLQSLQSLQSPQSPQSPQSLQSLQSGGRAGSSVNSTIPRHLAFSPGQDRGFPLTHLADCEHPPEQHATKKGAARTTPFPNHLNRTDQAAAPAPSFFFSA